MSYRLPSRVLASQSGSAMVQNPTIPRSKFLNRFTIKKPFYVGGLFPLYVDEVLPGDLMRYRATAYVRTPTLLYPNFDNLQLDTFWFFVPMRLVWSDSEKFFGAQANPADSINFTIPQLVLSNTDLVVDTLFDHMGLPAANLAAGQSITVNALPLRAYNLIYNQWFRDQNLQNSVTVATGAGPDSVGWYTVLNRAKAHDYFASALPWPQKFTAPTVPLTGQAPITGIGFVTANMPTASTVHRETGGANVAYPFSTYTTVATTVGVRGTAAAGASPEIYANLSATGAGLLLNNLRQAWLIQALLERDARGGTRYIEKVYHQFGVVSPDARLDRPEYIGGGSTPLMTTPIAQTATGGAGVGALGATATATGQHVAEFAATEHGYIIGLVNVRSELSYSQGLRKMWSRLTQYDFYIPALAGLGEQAILQQELYCTGIDSADNTVFGYQERWHEYRTLQSEIHGVMRPQAGSTLAFMHLGQLFTSAPTLGTTFIQETRDQLRRAITTGAATDNQQFLGTFLLQREATRPIPMYGTPVSLDRF